MRTKLDPPLIKTEPAGNRSRDERKSPGGWSDPDFGKSACEGRTAAKPPAAGSAVSYCDATNALSSVERQDSDLEWLSLSSEGGDRTARDDLCRLALVGESDADAESPDPFLSDEDWRALRKAHASE